MRTYVLYSGGVNDVEYREEPCRSALNRVRGMPFEWSLNPYMGCAHQCTFCYVRAFEARADRPSDDRYGRSIRVKVNVAEVLRRELARPSWKGDGVAVGAATDPYQPAEGRYRLTRACLEAFAEACEPVLADHARPDDRARRGRARRGIAARRRLRDVLGADARSGGLAHDRARHRSAAPAAARAQPARGRRHQGRRRDGADPAGSLRPARAARGGRPRRAGGRRDGIWANLLYLRPGTREHFLQALARDWPEQLDRYESLYERRAYLTNEQTKPVKEAVGELRRRYGIADRRPARIQRAAREEQLSLTV